jgi:hypothetical protein
MGFLQAVINRVKGRFDRRLKLGHGYRRRVWVYQRTTSSVEVSGDGFYMVY